MKLLGYKIIKYLIIQIFSLALDYLADIYWAPAECWELCKVLEMKLLKDSSCSCGAYNIT